MPDSIRLAGTVLRRKAVVPALVTLQLSYIVLFGLPLSAVWANDQTTSVNDAPIATNQSVSVETAEALEVRRADVASRSVPLPPRNSSRLASNNADPAIPWYRTMAGSLGIVLALVGALYVCVRRWMPSQTAAESGLLRVVARSHLSPKQGVALIQLGRRFVLVGVSPGRLQPLSEITDPEEVADLTVREATGSATRKDYSRFEAILQGRAGEFEQPSAPPTDFAPARRSPAAGSSPGLGDLVRRLKSLQT